MDLNELTIQQKRVLAIDVNTTPENLTILAKDENYYVRWNVARNPNTPPETLTILATDKEPDVRWYVSQNPNTPPETLTLLANDEDFYVRSCVARNPNTPQYVKDYLIVRNFMESYLINLL
jgi:hypothetical protein